MVTIDQVLISKLNSWYIGEWPIGNFLLCCIALLLTVILCGAIGIERERRGRSAGLRTHLLVGTGSCIIMIISIYGFPHIVQGTTVYTRDVARLAAQVIAGVGFLGAGAIIHRNSGTKGLTTAATIWIAMAIGLACGSMNFILAIGGTLLILLVLVFFKKVEIKINRKAPAITIKVAKDTPILSKVLEVSALCDYEIHELEVGTTEMGDVEIRFVAVANKKDPHLEAFVSKLELIEGIKSVSLGN